MSVADALKASADETLLVNGWLTDRPGETRLCTTLEQGPYLSPPECGEPSVSVQLTLSGTPSYSLLGLDWVEPRKRRIGGITWVNEPVQVYGDILRKAGREPELIPRSRP